MNTQLAGTNLRDWAATVGGSLCIWPKISLDKSKRHRSYQDCYHRLQRYADAISNYHHCFVATSMPNGVLTVIQEKEYPKNKTQLAHARGQQRHDRNHPADWR